MSNWPKAIKIGKEIDKKRVELSQAPTKEEKNAIKAEIKYLKQEQRKAIGPREYEMLEEGKTTKEDIQIIKTYNSIKEKENIINPLSIATRRWLILQMETHEENRKRLVA